MSGRLWPIAEPAQADYERLREIVLMGGERSELLAARRFARPRPGWVDLVASGRARLTWAR